MTLGSRRGRHRYRCRSGRGRRKVVCTHFHFRGQRAYWLGELLLFSVMAYQPRCQSLYYTATYIAVIISRDSIRSISGRQSVEWNVELNTGMSHHNLIPKPESSYVATYQHKCITELRMGRDEPILPALFLEKQDYESKEQNSGKISGVSRQNQILYLNE